MRSASRARSRGDSFESAGNNLGAVRGVRLALAGAGLGVLVALRAARLVQSLLYETPALHPAIYAAATGLVMVVAIVAAGPPALRAGRINRITALRQE